MYKAFIEPDLKTAHLQVYNNFNPFSGFMEPTFILKSDRAVTEGKIQQVLGGAESVKKEEIHTVDIYLLPPHEDPETCTSWLRMRNRDGKYQLMFEETVTDGDFIISPRITFEVSVRLLGGLMALGYQIGTIMRRKTIAYSHESGKGMTVKIDEIENFPRACIQVHGRKRDEVRAAGRELGLEGHYIARSYIEQAQYNNLTKNMAMLSEDIRLTFNIDENVLGTSPLVQSLSWGSFKPMPGMSAIGGGRKRGGGEEDSDGESGAAAARPRHRRGSSKQLGGPRGSEAGSEMSGFEGGNGDGAASSDGEESASTPTAFGGRMSKTQDDTGGLLSQAMANTTPRRGGGPGGFAGPFAGAGLPRGMGQGAGGDVRRVEGTLASLNEKMDSLPAQLQDLVVGNAARLEAVSAAMAELAAKTNDMMGTVQASLSTQQAILSKIALQQEGLAASVGASLATPRPSVSGGATPGSLRRGSLMMPRPASAADVPAPREEPPAPSGLAGLSAGEWGMLGAAAAGVAALAGILGHRFATR